MSPVAKFQITRATSADDIRAVADLFRAYARSLSVDLAYQDFESELAALPGKYESPRGALLLARASDSEPIGCVALRPLDAPGHCEMKRLYVAPGGRGMGLGRALLDAVLATARAAGYSEIRLDTLPDMKNAQALYGKSGFEVIAPYYDTPVTGTVFMRRTL